MIDQGVELHELASFAVDGEERELINPLNHWGLRPFEQARDGGNKKNGRFGE
jgi:hypothetical protein